MMNKLIFIITVFVSAIIIFSILYILNNKNNHTNDDNNNNKKKKYNGLVLFDIDGTLSVDNTGETNYLIVKACIDNNFAVGICTAGSLYTMKNLNTFHWMPKNLYDFIVKEENKTFNNVGSLILMGKQNTEAYLTLEKEQSYLTLVSKNPSNGPGYLKGFALMQTANALGINNPKCMILCDDQSSFIKGALAYNKDLTVVCSGENCQHGLKLNLDAVTKAMIYCSNN